MDTLVFMVVSYILFLAVCAFMSAFREVFELISAD